LANCQFSLTAQASLILFDLVIQIARLNSFLVIRQHLPGEALFYHYFQTDLCIQMSPVKFFEIGWLGLLFWTYLRKRRTNWTIRLMKFGGSKPVIG
jgi:hypothetical protein